MSTNFHKDSAPKRSEVSQFKRQNKSFQCKIQEKTNRQQNHMQEFKIKQNNSNDMRLLKISWKKQENLEHSTTVKRSKSLF